MILTHATMKRKFSDQDEGTTLGRFAVTAFSWFALANCVHFLDRILSEVLATIGQVAPSTLVSYLLLRTYRAAIYLGRVLKPRLLFAVLWDMAHNR